MLVLTAVLASAFVNTCALSRVLLPIQGILQQLFIALVKYSTTF